MNSFSPCPQLDRHGGNVPPQQYRVLQLRTGGIKYLETKEVCLEMLVWLDVETSQRSLS